MMISKLPVVLRVTSGLAFVLMATSVAAQTGQVADGAQAAEDRAADQAADEIVVTAQGRTQRLRDVPVAASVVSGAQLEHAMITNLESLSVRTPNVRIAPAPVSDFIAVRGVGSSLNLGFEQSVGTFVDGIYRGRSRSTRAALFDLERVEILKGPQSIFFGNNTIAGALNIQTRKPGHDFSVNGLAYYSPTYGEYSVEAGISVPLTETLSVRVAGRQSGSDGYIRNSLTGDKGPHLNDRVGRASLAWTPSSNVEVDARLDVGRMRDRLFDLELVNCPPSAELGGATGACARFLAARGGRVDDKLDRRTDGPPSGYLNLNYVEGAWRTAVTLGDLRVTALTGYYHHDYDLLNDVLPIAPQLGGNVVKADRSVPIVVNEKYRQFSQELRLETPAENQLSFIGGLYYAHDRLEADQYQALYFLPFGNFTNGYYAPNAPLVNRVRVRQTTDTMSLFGATTYKFNDRVRLNLGLRYSIVDKRASRDAIIGLSADPGNAGNVTASPPNIQAIIFGITKMDAGDFVRPSRSDKKLLPSASLQFDVTPDVMAYGSYSKGFKSGGFSIGLSKSIFEPETVDAFEVGLKGGLFDRKVDFGLAVFHSKYKDLQETTTISTNVGAQQIVGNVGGSVAKGVELNLGTSPVSGLRLTTDLAYLVSKYTDYPGAPCTPLQSVNNPTCTQNLSGKARAFAPRWSGNVNLDYRAPIATDLELGLGSTFYFSSRYFQQPIAYRPLSQSAFGKLDLRLSLGSPRGDWEAAVIVRNVTDRQTASYRQLFPVSGGSYAALADPPRSVGLQLTFKH